MVFSSFIFLFYFFPIFILIYLITPRRARNYTLLLASLIFYFWGAPHFILILVSTTLVDFFIVRQMHQTGSRQLKSFWLTCSLTLTIGIFFYFKYANFFVDNINEALRVTGVGKIGWTRIVLPIGISFFSFQKITYALDVYRDTHPPLKNPLEYLLYIIMFPQLIAGPIVRFHMVADQIRDRRSSVNDFFHGFIRFIIGLSKKVLIANTLGAYADPIFNNIASINTLEAWVALFCYTFQIYFDFSGYSDMAIGIGRMIGFRFPENFNNPYISQSITEFWRRWHMTLGSWFKDYLYIPLGGNRVKTKRRLYFNLSFVFIVSGLWHGASWNFVLWGAYHGTFLILDRIFLEKYLHKAGKWLSIPLTFLVTILGWVIFRIQNLSEIGQFYGKLFRFGHFKLLFAEHYDVLGTIMIATFFSFFTLIPIGRKTESLFFYRQLSLVEKTVIFLLCAVLLVLCTGSLAVSNFNPFIYFRF